MYRWRNAFIALCAPVGLAAGSQWQEAFAVPTMLTVQGHLSANGGASVTGDYTIVLALYSSRTAPTAFWEESNVVTVINGLFDARIGADVINPVTVEDFAQNTEVWIGITVIEGPGVPNGGEAELPRRRLGSTGYAFAAGYADAAGVATRATTAGTADSAALATRATSADRAGALSCSSCISISQLGFDPATQVELQNALAALNIPTSVNGLSGGTISGNVAVSGSMTAASFSLAGGQSLCDSSGNCGATLKSLTCVAPNDTPVYNHTSSVWQCGPRDLGGSVTATDLNCSGCVSESELGFNVVTDGELASALTAYAKTTSLSAYATTAQLANYATTAALSSYATTAALGNYATTAALNTALGNYTTTAALNTALGNYATTAALSNYATTASLDAYATDAEVNTKLESYTTLAALAVALGDYATVTDVAAALTSYATTAVLGAYAKLTDLDAYALKTEIPTSIDGLAGGTVTGAVTATNTVEGPIVRQNGNVVCDESGNCGRTMDDFVCDPGQTLVRSGADWECQAAAAGSPPAACVGPGKALQWDGTDWRCVDIRNAGESGGKANGFELRDDWGDTWDGSPRSAKTWPDADETCRDAGGRLPTVTEMWRNRASNGTGNVGSPTDTYYHWTIAPSYRPSYYLAVYLATNSRTEYINTTRLPFRCIWKSQKPTGFSGNRCFGPPGAECASKNSFFNMDKWSRAPQFLASARRECELENASVMTANDYEEEIMRGTTFTTYADEAWPLWHWTLNTNYHDNGYSYASVLRWTNALEEYWGPTAGWAYHSGPNNWYTFRCVGKKAPNLGVMKDVPQCQNDNCFVAGAKTTRSRLVADNENRAAAPWHTAFKTCRAAGGYLPTAAEFMQLIQSGWENGPSPGYLWSSSPATWGGQLFRWAGVGTIYWYGHYHYGPDVYTSTEGVPTTSYAS